MDRAKYASYLTVAALGGAAAVALVAPAMAESMQFDRAAILGGQGWRLVTGHLAHFGWNHGLWDIAAFLALAAACVKFSPRRTLAAIFGSMLAVSVAVLVLMPQMRIYRGLSGVDSALFAMLAVCLLREWPAVGTAALVGLGAKLTYELGTGQAMFVSGKGFVPVPLAHAVGAVCGLLAMAKLPTLRRVAVPATLLVLATMQTGCVTSSMWKRGVPTKVHNPQVASGKQNGAVVIQYGEGYDTSRVILPIERDIDQLGPLRYRGGARTLAAIEQDVAEKQAKDVGRVVLPITWGGCSWRTMPPVTRTSGASGAASQRLDVEVFAFDDTGLPVGDVIRLADGRTSARFPENASIFLLPRTQPRSAGPIVGETLLLVAATPFTLLADVVVTPMQLVARSPLD